MSRRFTADYVERVELRDGTRVLLRLLQPEDRAQLRAGFEKLSMESRYARFFAPKTTLTDDELDYLCNVDQEHHFALGALVEDTGAGAGIARFIRLRGVHATAEAAIVVADELQGRGLGRLLFLRLCSAAAERGIERFRCEVLGSNHSMAGLIEHVSPENTRNVRSGVMSIDMVLPDVTPTEPPAPPPEESGMYKLLRMAAQNVVDLTETLRRLWGRDGNG